VALGASPFKRSLVLALIEWLRSFSVRISL
jgi:hypothetical protein